MGLESLGKKLAQLGQDTKSSVQKISENYSLNGKVAEEKRALDQLFAQIGEAVVEKISDGSLPVIEGLQEQLDAVKAAKETITSLEDQIQKLKGVSTCPSCGKEAGKGEKFCSACGAKLPEVAETVDQVAQSAREVGNEVGDVVNEAADKAKDFLGSFADKAGAFVQGVSSKLSPKEDDVADAANIQEAAEAVQETAEDAAEAVQEAAEDAAEAVQETAGAAEDAEE